MEAPDLRRECGAISIFAAAALVVALLAVVLAVDLGRLAWEKGELQKQVDLAALAGARDVGGCTSGATDPATVTQLVADANGFSGSLASSPNAVEVGIVETEAGYREFTATEDLASAEAIRVSGTVMSPLTRLFPALVSGSTPLRAEAVARARAFAGIRAGSMLLTASSSQISLLDQVLGAILGGSVDLDAVSYQGLLTGSVTLGELVEAHAAGGGLDQFLVSELSAGEFLTVIGRALADQGSPASVTANDLATAADPARRFTVGDLLQVDPASEDAALDSAMNVYDLALFSAQLANGDSAVTVSPLAVVIPGVATTSLELRIVEPPRIAFGRPGQDADGTWRTLVQTAQIRGQLTVQASTPISVSPLASATVSMTTYFEGAPARAYLRTIDCPRAGAPTSHVSIGAEPGLLTVGVGRYDDIEGGGAPVASQIATLRLLGIPIAGVRAQSSASLQSDPAILEFDGPFVPQISAPSTDNTQRAAGDAASYLNPLFGQLEADPGLTVTLLGSLPLGVNSLTIQNAALAVLRPILRALPAAVGPLGGLLGQHLGGVDVTVLSVRTERPTLVR